MYRSIIPNITDESMIGKNTKELLVENNILPKPKQEIDYTKVIYTVCIIVVVIMLVLLIYYMYVYYNKPTEKKEIKQVEKIVKPEFKVEQKKEVKNSIPDSILNMDNNILKQYISKNSNKPAEHKESSRNIEQQTLAGNVVAQITDNSDNIIHIEEKKITSLKDNLVDNDDWDGVEEPIRIDREEETMLMIQDMVNEHKTKIIITDINILNNTVFQPTQLSDDDLNDDAEDTLCAHIFKSGVNKGKRCSSKAIVENKCSKHH